MNRHDKVMRFIARFTQCGRNQGVIEAFTSGCCYWFAYILLERFYDIDAWNEDVELMYDQVENHFGCRIDGVVYDITGDVTDKYNWETWISVVNKDELHAERIIRDCVDF